ncbi:MAG: 3-methyl-2-oxobutanoate hydroxymethyltransferase [Elusimicrobiota bacterium]|jgi:3-methyl-2-oxobutanoate hydroxymethyltransferase|nr:3-methyl-2-oxobutanoate hydroxymethyltransferase [Elusimicrobiota bacterium]
MNTPSSIKKLKTKEKIAMLTAYDYSTARIMDAAGVDGILVGDTLGMVMLGYKNTSAVTMAEMLHHTKAVTRAVKNALVVADMPNRSYSSVKQALKNARLLIKEGKAKAVKLEGGTEVAAQIRALTRAKIPVMAHIGLLPQSVKSQKGFKVQGRDLLSARKILQDAAAVQKAGAFAVVVECVPEKLAKIITKTLTIPTIGIGAGKYCDGQVLVYQDMLGIYDKLHPKFVKKYADIGAAMKNVFQDYSEEVKKGIFPSREHSFDMDEKIISSLQTNRCRKKRNTNCG